MVRLILTLTPVVCMLGGIAMSVTFDHYLKDDDTEDEIEQKPKVAKVRGQFLSSLNRLLNYSFSGKGQDRRD